MPKQRTLFGRPIPPLSPRRVAPLLGAAIMLILIVLISTSGSVAVGARIGNAKSKLSPSSILHQFRQPVHAPPVQANSTRGESSWHSAWNWLSPFSSSTTLDENRSLLPPLAERPPIYTYYDQTIKKDAGLKEAEHEILVTWRRAWWAQGFRPVVLGPAEAMSNPSYQQMQFLNLNNTIQTEMMRWLAWDAMGTGVLAHYLTFPMGAYESPLLSYFRRHEYPLLRRFDGLGSNLFSGSKFEINSVVQLAITATRLAASKDLIDVMPKDTFLVDTTPSDIANYDAETIRSKYPKVADAIVDTGATGMIELNDLINSHLHGTWQNLFDRGIEVTQPGKRHMATLLKPAIELAHTLAQCPVSPVLSSCPPNLPKCAPCVATHAMKVAMTEQFHNTSDIYTIGIIPHPYTYLILDGYRETIDITYLRRETKRDDWVRKITLVTAGSGVASSRRVVKVKEAVASAYGIAHSIWFAAEDPIPDGLDWHFGFRIPKSTQDSGRSETPVPGPERRPKKQEEEEDSLIISEEELAQESNLIRAAKMVVQSKIPDMVRQRRATEAWNLADMEAWRFVKAFMARRTTEHQLWEEAEAKYAGGLDADTKRSAWFDKDPQAL